MDIKIPEEAFLDMVNYAAEEMRKAYEENTVEGDEREKGKQRIQKEEEPKPILTAPEKRRYHYIGEELFAGGERRLREIQAMLDFQKKMKGVFDAVYDKTIDLPKNLWEGSKNLAKDVLSSFRNLFALIGALRLAFVFAEFMVPMAADLVKWYFNPLLGFAKDFWESRARPFYENVKESMAKKIEMENFEKTPIAKLTASLVREFQQTFDQVYNDITNLYEQYREPLTYLFETLTWASLGGFLFGPIGAGIGALIGVAIAAVEIEMHNKEQEVLVQQRLETRKNQRNLAEVTEEQLAVIQEEIKREEGVIVDTYAKLMAKKRRIAELRFKAAELERRKRFLQFTASIKDSFWYGTSGKKPDIVYILQNLGYQEGVDFQLERIKGIQYGDKFLGGVVGVKSIFGIPYQLHGDNVEILQRLMQEVGTRFKNETQGTPFAASENFNVNLAKFLSDVENVFKNGYERSLGVERRVLTNGVALKDVFIGFRDFYNTQTSDGKNLFETLRRLMDETEKTVEEIENGYVMSDEERELYVNQEIKMKNLLNDIQKKKTMLAGLDIYSEAFGDALLFYKGIPLKRYAVLQESVMEGIANSFKSFLDIISKVGSKRPIVVEEENSMVNVIRIINSQPYQNDASSENFERKKREELQKNCRSIGDSSDNIVKILKKGKQTPEKSPQTEEAQPLTLNEIPQFVGPNVFVLPYSIATVGEDGAVFENTEAYETHEKFASSGSFISRNNTAHDITVIA